MNRLISKKFKGLDELRLETLQRNKGMSCNLHKEFLQIRQHSKASNLRPLGHQIITHIENPQVIQGLDAIHFFNEIVRDPKLLQ
jgi:hypothetical protein